MSTRRTRVVSPADDNNSVGGNNDAGAAQLPAVQADAPPSPLRNDGAAAAAAVAALEEDAPPSPQRNNNNDDASAASINPFGPDPDWLVDLEEHAAAADPEAANADVADPEAANADDNRDERVARAFPNRAAERAATAARARARAAADAHAHAQNAMAFLGLDQEGDGGANANFNVFHNDNERDEENHIPFEDNCPITHSPAAIPVGLLNDIHAFDLHPLRGFFRHDLGFHAIQNADGTEGETVYGVRHPMSREIIPQSRIESSIIPITGERAERIRAERVRLGME